MSFTYYSRDKNKQAWYNFVQNGGIPNHVEPDIKEAWIRCKASGISPYLNATNKLTGEELTQCQLKNEFLTKVSKPPIEKLYQFLQGSGFAVALSNSDGILLDVLGDDDVISDSHGNLVVGADWSELGIGANSIGTSLYLDAPTQYWGFEHYCRLPQRWAGGGAPIHDPSGALIGCLDIAGKIEHSHRHTLGMAVITAQAIDMQLKLEQILNLSDQTNQHLEAIIGAMSEGLIILDEAHSIVLANNHVAAKLSAQIELLLGHSIKELCADTNLLKIIYNHQRTTDYFTSLAYGKKEYACTITCQAIPNSDGKVETLLLINDILRAKKLVRKFAAGEASFTFDDIIGKDMRLKSVISLAQTAAETSANVLVLGESGTGKEVFAQAIHTGSSRASGPFIAINCAVIPKELVASTLFGYEEGAFTGAKRGGAPGKFEMADHGTLFLDEIGELPLDTQAVLLRVLETKRFNRVGGKEDIDVDVRIIAATNRDLLQESQVNRFRLDLYYRLNVLSLNLPPLRERKTDIPLLAAHFLRQMNCRYNKVVTEIVEEAIELLLHHEWLGNIRELQNTIERAVIITETSEISCDTIRSAITPSATVLQRCIPAVPVASHLREQSMAVPSGERERLIRLLEECRWNITKAALKLGVARSTLYRKIYYYNLKNEE